MFEGCSQACAAMFSKRFSAAQLVVDKGFHSDEKKAVLHYSNVDHTYMHRLRWLVLHWISVGGVAGALLVV